MLANGNISPDERERIIPFPTRPSAATDATPVILPAERERDLWKLFREFFDLAERKRRWRIADDIPWDQCNPNLKPAVADIIETFCAVELVSARLLSEDPAQGPAQQIAHVVLRQLGIRRVEALDGAGRLVAQVRPPIRRVHGRPGRESVCPRVEPAAGQSSRHVGLRHGPGGGDVSQLPQPQRCAFAISAATRARKAAQLSWRSTRRPITPSSATA